jgi:hypothetical protein
MDSVIQIVEGEPEYTTLTVKKLTLDGER